MNDTTNLARARDALHARYRQQLENRVLDAEIHCEDLRQELRALLVEYRYYKWFVRHSRAHLAHEEFLWGVRVTHGLEVATIVEQHSQP